MNCDLAVMECVEVMVACILCKVSPVMDVEQDMALVIHGTVVAQLMDMTFVICVIVPEMGPVLLTKH